MSSYVPVIVACALPHTGGILGGLITRRNLHTFYEPLKKPWWTPSKLVISSAWTVLYTGMGYASYLIWKETGGYEGEGKLALTLYGTQLALNWAWPVIFFGSHRMGLAFLEILALYGTVVGCTYVFYPINKIASYLMFPYLAWMTLATSLNYRIWRDNTPKIKEVEEKEK